MYALGRWSLFAAYLTVFTSFPLAILFEWTGLALGVSISASILLFMGVNAEKRIFIRLKLNELTIAEAPELYHTLGEYCRRLHLPTPRLAIMDSLALNIGSLGGSFGGEFGYNSKKKSYLILTTGLLKSCNRAEISALMGRELLSLHKGESALGTWLCQFLYFVEIVALRKSSPRTHQKLGRIYSFTLFLRQLCLLPLALFPKWLLMKASYSPELENAAAKLTQSPHALAEAYRQIKALSGRQVFRAPFNSRHLFLFPPPPQDPLARTLFQEPDLSGRIQALGKLQKLVGQS